jgi:translation initiation factor 3 subunit C
MANRFLKGAASSDEESDEEDKTVVMSAKDKRWVVFTIHDSVVVC